jgi:DNA processing protein
LAQRARAQAVIEAAARIDARLVTLLDDDYPANLRLIFNLPPFLFVPGKLRRDDTLAAAVVGTREASPEGLRRANKLAALLVERMVTVLLQPCMSDRHCRTSGHAGGWRTDDRCSRHGHLRTCPPKNEELPERIVERGALVSQFWPDQSPARFTFPRRNVVTSGIGHGTVVIGASSTSGAKMQARLALEHGEQVSC